MTCGLDHKKVTKRDAANRDRHVAHHFSRSTVVVTVVVTLGQATEVAEVPEVLVEGRVEPQS